MIVPGYWTDVCLIAGQFVQVTTDGPLVRGFINGVEQWRIEAPEPLLFCRCANWQGLPISIHQGNNTGYAYLVTPQTIIAHGPTFGVQPVIVDSTYAYVVRSPNVYDRINLDNGGSEQFPSGAPGSSQGISDLVDGVLWWADLHRTVERGGITFYYPNQRGSVVVGQADPAQCAGWNGFNLFTAVNQPAYEPHVAYNGASYAVVARTGAGAAYLEVPPYPPFVTAPEPPEPEPGPEPEPPDPGPEPPDPPQPPLPDEPYYRVRMYGP